VSGQIHYRNFTPREKSPLPLLERRWDIPQMLCSRQKSLISVGKRTLPVLPVAIRTESRLFVCYTRVIILKTVSTGIKLLNMHIFVPGAQISRNNYIIWYRIF
jgi:hypothetical protein